tara:strand:- start:1302 stop:1691 length:390 start_codon:yes stop_codon:yes gene_type:complete
MKNNSDNILQKIHVLAPDKVDTDKFLDRLHLSIKERDENQRVFKTSIIMIIVLFILSYMRFDIPSEIERSYYISESDNLFKTDIWSIEIDSDYVDDNYSNELAYFLLNEGDLWEALDVFNEILLDKEES